MRADRNELKAASFISMLWIPSACYLLGSLRRFPHDATQELQDQQHHTPSSLSAALQPLQTQSWGPRRCADAAAGRFHVVTSWGDQRLPPHFLQSFTLTGFCSRLDNDICKHSECCIIISNQRKKLRSGLRNAQLSGTLPGRVLTRSRRGGAGFQTLVSKCDLPCQHWRRPSTASGRSEERRGAPPHGFHATNMSSKRKASQFGCGLPRSDRRAARHSIDDDITLAFWSLISCSSENYHLYWRPQSGASVNIQPKKSDF